MMELLRFIPRNLLSWFIGKLAHLEHPRFLVKRAIAWFISRYQIDCTEIAQEIDSFPSLGAFFVRSLTAEARPIAEGIVSPVDGMLTQYGTVADGAMIQAKGRTYSVRSLLQDDEESAIFSPGGTYATIYLAPPDYHCIHSPVSGSITKTTYIPGSLWPVNDWSVNSIENLFPRNERIISYIDSDVGRVAVVMVGATNVGAIALAYDDIVSNSSPPLLIDRREVRELHHEGIVVRAGDKLAEFRLGSTVILLFEPNMVTLKQDSGYARLKFGEVLASRAP